MQAKIVFRGNKCFREFDLKTVAEKLGLSIDDFNHFALAVDEKNGKTILYNQAMISEAMGLSITNEHESFTQIEINRYTHKFLYSRLNALPSMFPAGSLTGFSTW